MDKKIEKYIAKKCILCDESDYALLDVHRIIPGEHGGKYIPSNTVVLCANCHRRVHSGTIQILGKHYSTAGRHLIHYVEDGVEQFK